LNNNSLLIIGITGSTGSGKSYLTNNLIKKYSSNLIDKIEVDSYYKNLSHLTMEKRSKNNFDHPNAFEFELLIDDLKKIKSGKDIKIPVYDYSKHLRTKKYRKINSDIKVLLIEGIYALYDKSIVNTLDQKVYIDIAQEKCISRRIERDITSRGRTVESIKKQINTTVIPMFEKFIKPTKDIADLIIKKTDDDDSEFVKLISIIDKHIN
tara:strand:- start:2460 stop:3086 length:627 start_codon:yes stop_codon:yes gene_type:complete